jgi:hypothetical protein
MLLVLNEWTGCESSIEINALLPACYTVPLTLDWSVLYANYWTNCETWVDLSEMWEPVFLAWLGSQPCQNIPCICDGAVGNIPVYNAVWRQEISSPGHTTAKYAYYSDPITGKQIVAYDDPVYWVEVKEWIPATLSRQVLATGLWSSSVSQLSVTQDEIWNVYVGTAGNVWNFWNFCLFRYERATSTWLVVFNSTWISTIWDICFSNTTANKKIYMVFDDVAAGILKCYSTNTTTLNTTEVSWWAPNFKVSTIQGMECKIRSHVLLWWTATIQVAYIDTSANYEIHLSTYEEVTATWAYSATVPLQTWNVLLSLAIHQGNPYITFSNWLWGNKFYTYTGSRQEIPFTPQVYYKTLYTSALDELYLVGTLATRSSGQYVYKRDWNDFLMLGLELLTWWGMNNQMWVDDINWIIYATNNYSWDLTIHTRRGVCVLVDSWVSADRLVPQSWIDSPVWTHIPRFVWDRYVQTNGPTIWTGYGLTNADWIS